MITAWLASLLFSLVCAFYISYLKNSSGTLSIAHIRLPHLLPIYLLSTLLPLLWFLRVLYPKRVVTDESEVYPVQAGSPEQLVHAAFELSPHLKLSAGARGGHVRDGSDDFGDSE